MGGYTIELEFNDGKSQNVNFEPFLQKSLHPEIRSYLNRDKFTQFRVEYGDLVWGDFELCFPVKDLYANQIFSQQCGFDSGLTGSPRTDRELLIDYETNAAGYGIPTHHRGDAKPLDRRRALWNS